MYIIVYIHDYNTLILVLLRNQIKYPLHRPGPVLKKKTIWKAFPTSCIAELGNLFSDLTS